MDKKYRVFICWSLLSIPITVWGQSIQLADSLLKQGNQYDRRGNMKQAEFYYAEAYKLYRNLKDTTSWLEAGKEYANTLIHRSKTDQAMEMYKMLLEVDHPSNDIYNRGDLYNSMGLASNKIEKLDQAREYYQKSLPLALESGDSLLIGVVYDNLGGNEFVRGKYSKSLASRQKALAYFKALDRPKSIAITLSNIGLIYQRISLYDKALSYYNQSLDLSESMGDIRMLSTTYDNIAWVQQLLGNYDQALIASQKSLSYSKQAGTPGSTARILNNIGLLYKRLGEYEKAGDYYRQSLKMKAKTAGPKSIATTTQNMGMLLWRQGEIEEATDLYQKALTLRKQVGNPYDIASSLNTMVTLELKNHNIEQAREYAEQIQAIGDSTKSYTILQKASSYFGDICAAENKNQRALEYFKKAYEYSKNLPPRRQLGPLQQIAYHYHKLNSDSAVTYGQKAIDIIEQSRLKAGSTWKLKSEYLKKHSDFYMELASWVLKYKQDTPRVFRLVEQARARSFNDDLAKASQNIDRQLPDEVRINRKYWRESIDSLFTRLESSDDKEEQAQLSEEIRTAELDYAAYENKLASQYPVLKKMERPEPINLKQAQSLVDEETVILEYAVAGNELMIFLIGRDEVRVEQFSLPGIEPLADELTARITRFRNLILSNAEKDELKAASDALYNVMLKPFEESLRQYSNIIMVPNGSMAYLPFEALMQDDQYLIENFRIKYIPSLTSLTLLEKPELMDRKELLGVAGSQFTGRIDEPVIGTNHLSSLPSTILEVDSVSSHFREVSLLKDKEVSEQAFKALLQQNRYRYIHLATHGIINEKRPERSALTLSANREITASSEEDGMLRSSEIFGLDLSSDMVVLSACNTGLGKIIKGEGMLGMQRSFFYAGAATVVVSLWNVFDRSTAALMNEFYKALISNERETDWIDSMLRWIGWDQSIPFGKKAAAMRRAKLKMINHPVFNHPVYWAPFVVVGR